MSLLNKNFSNHADSQVGVHRITFEESHPSCEEYLGFFTKSGEWLKSHKAGVFGSCSLRK